MGEELHFLEESIVLALVASKFNHVQKGVRRRVCAGIIGWLSFCSDPPFYTLVCDVEAAFSLTSTGEKWEGRGRENVSLFILLVAS